MRHYFNPRSRAATSDWMLKELDAAHEQIVIDIQAGEQNSPEYRAINPMGKVPTLVDGEVVVTEAAAICAYLADKYENQAAAMEPAQKTDPKVFEAALKKPEGERFLALAQAMGVVEFFKARGVSEDQAKACLSDPKNTKELIAMTEKASDPEGSYKVTGTPSFFLNGAPVKLSNGSPVWTQIKSALQNAGAR